MLHDRFQRTAFIALVCDSIYILWLSQHLQGAAGIIYFCLELMLYGLFALFIYNHWHRSYLLLGGPYSLRPPVDIYIPTVNESIPTLRKTIKAASQILYPYKTVYVLDDGNRPRLKALAAELGCMYIHRPDTATRRFKAANLNYALAHSRGTFILTIDADHVVTKEILDDLLGHFTNPRVAFIATRQGFAVADNNFNHDHVFYEYMQSGKNQNNAAISCGSGVIYRRTALEDIGGFQEWNLVEDLYTSYVFHEHGYTSVYSSQRYSKGHAPQDLKTIYKQRRTWAFDTLRLWIWKFPLLNYKLTWPQRLHYLEIGYGYVVSATVIPGLALFNTYVALSNTNIIHSWPMFLGLKVISFYLILRFYYVLDQGTDSSRMWAGLFPVYATALWRALLYTKPVYTPTSKKAVRSNPLSLLAPHTTLLFLLAASLVYHVSNYGLSLLLAIHVFWFLILIYWFLPIYTLGFSKASK